MSKMKISRGISILPSLCTTASMLCGFFSIIRSIGGDHQVAAWAIFVAGFFDMIDGRVARMTNTQSDFGKEYDSLVDLASFGMAPSILMYTWTLSKFKPYGFVFAFIYFAAVALRLARFNVQTGTVEKGKFQGLPCPAAGGLLASFVLFYYEFVNQIPVKNYFSLIVVPLVSFLMVSNVRFKSFKDWNVQKDNVFYFLVGAAVFVGFIAIKPELVLFAIGCLYVLSGVATGILGFFRPESRKKQLAAQSKLDRLKSSPKKFSLVEDGLKPKVTPLKKTSGDSYE